MINKASERKLEKKIILNKEKTLTKNMQNQDGKK